MRFVARILMIGLLAIPALDSRAQEFNPRSTPVNRPTTRQGWTLITEQDTQSMLAQVRVVIQSGSLSEPADRPGLASFTGRALLRGTKSRPYQELIHSIERLGGSLTVYTDETQTWLCGVVLARNLAPFLQILNEVLTQPAFSPGDVEQLRGILQGELRTRFQDVRTVAAAAAMQEAWKGTRVATFPGGTVDSLSRITAPELQRFFEERYVRENMVIAVSSPLSEDEIRQRIESGLSAIPSGRKDSPRVPAPRLQGRRAVIVSRDAMSTTPMFIAVPGVADGNPVLPTLEVGNFVFGADFTSRLVQVLRAENGWTYGVSSGWFQLLDKKPDPGLFSIYTYPSVEHAAKALSKAIVMLEEYSSQGVTPAEFEGAREALINRYAFALSTAERRLERRLREVLNGRKFETVDQFRSRLSRLRLEDLNAAIFQSTPTRDMTIAVVGDPSALKPALETIPGIQSVEVVEVRP